MKTDNKAFTLIEVMVVIGIFLAIFSMTFYFFGPLGNREVLEKDASSLTALIRNARLLSVASKNASPFGIHLENDGAALFEGSSYVPGGANEKRIRYSGRVYMSAHSLNSGGADILFSRLTGETADFGTITLSLTDNSTSTTITVLRTGIIK